MKKITILSALVLLVVSFSAMGQDKEVKAIKKINISDVQIQSGMFMDNMISSRLQDFYALAPKSTILSSMPAESFSSEKFMGNPTKIFSAALGIQFGNKEKTTYHKNPLLRLGISFYSGANLSGGAKIEDRKPFDTLTSSQTGQVYFIDSVTTQNYKMQYLSDQMRFDGSVIFRTNPDSRFSIYAGIGISAGISISSSTKFNYNKDKRTEENSWGNNEFMDKGKMDMEKGTEEIFSNKNNFGASAYIPLGFDFRLGRKNAFWKQIHLFDEMRPGINFTSIPELGTYTNSCFQMGFGLRVSWN